MTVLTEFRPGLWLTELDLGDFAVRGALIIGTEAAVVWDTLSQPRDMQPLRAHIGNRALRVVYSHADWDHVWGTAGLAEPGAPVISHAACLDRFGADVPVTLAEKQAAEPGVWDDVLLMSPTQTFECELALDLDGITLELHHLPGHTPDCIVGFIPEWGLLLAGDTVESPLPVVPADSPLDRWIAELQRWAADTRVQTVIPAHGAIGGRALITRNIAYLQALRTGGPLDVPDHLDDFYRETHAANQQWGGLGSMSLS